MNVPTPVFLVTTRKENGLSNVQLNAWGMLIGSGTEPKFILQVMNNSDTLRLIERNKEFVINLPSYSLKERLLKAAEHFDAETDEIAAAGFTAENAGLIKAPRIRECFAHYECVLDWVKPVEEKVRVNTLVQGSVVRAAIDEEYLADDMRRSIPPTSTRLSFLRVLLPFQAQLQRWRRILPSGREWDGVRSVKRELWQLPVMSERP